MNKLKKLISLALSLCIMGSIAVTSSVTASAEFSQSSYAFSQNMTIGYNIGNSLDSVLTSSADETYWGCPKITQGLVQAIKDKGYDVIRIPVTWGFKINSSGNFTDSNVHANRVKQVVDWAYNTGAYVILNTHHEMSWLNTWDSVKNSSASAVDSSKQEAMLTKFGGLWKNIANTYKDYGERLIFEGYNETRSSETVWSSVTRDQEVLQKIGQKFIDTVRATGGNNSKRYLLLNTFGAVFSTNEVNTYKMPTDSADHLLFGVHTYDPHDLCFREYSGTTFSQSAFDSYYNTVMPAIETKFLSKGYGVILGEFGAVNKNNDNERVKYAKAVVTSCAKYGVIPVWWGNGVINMNSSKDSFGLVSRVAPYEWVKDNIASAMVDLAYQLVPSRPTRGGTSQTRTTTETNVTQTTTTTTTGSTSAVGANSTVIDWEDGDTSFVSSSTSVVSSKISSAMTIEGSTKALEVSSSNWDETTGNNYVQIALDKTAVQNARDIKVNIGSNSTTGNKAHFGIVMNGTVYWDFAYMGGSVEHNTYTEFSLLNKSFVSLKDDNTFQTNGAYDVQVKVKSTNISKITAIVVSPTNNSNVQKVYVDDIIIVDKEDIPTVEMPSKGSIFCDWKGTVNFVKTDGWDSHSTNLSEMPNAYQLSDGMLKLNTQGYSYNSLMVQTEITLDTVQAATAIAAAKQNDGYLYMKIRFHNAYNPSGKDCGVKFKLYCFADGNWQNAVYMIGENDAIMSTAGELLVKYHVDNFEGMIPDTIAIIVMNQTYYNGLSAVNVEFSDIYATGDVPSTSATVPSAATTTTTTKVPTTTTTTTVTDSDESVKGDLNGDGKLNSLDVLAMKKYVVSGESVLSYPKADLNGDGNINSTDILYLKRLVANG